MNQTRPEKDLSTPPFVAVGRRHSILETTAEGAGPVDALSKAMRKELERWYPTMKQMRLETFSVAAIDISATTRRPRARHGQLPGRRT